MDKIQEYFLRAFLAAVISALVAAPIAAMIVGTISGADNPQQFVIGASILTAVVLFFTPWLKRQSEDWVKEMAFKEVQRVAELKRQNEWAKQKREEIATMRKTAVK